MRIHIVRAVVCLALVFGSGVAMSMSTGPPLSRTGAPAIGGKPAESLCTLCHNAYPPDQANGGIEILDLPQSYVGGQIYPLRVRLHSTATAADEFRKWGFQIAAMFADNGEGAGSWTVPTSGSDALKITSYSGSSTSPFKTRRYVSHQSVSTRTGASSPVEWSFTWTAPVADSVDVHFFAAGNAANGDEMSGAGSNDNIYTTSAIVRARAAAVSVPVPVAATYQTSFEPPYPNPMSLCTDLSFTLARAGTMTLAIHDLSGRRVRTILHGWHAAGPGFAFWDGRRDDGRQAPNGVYFARLAAPGEPRLYSRKITLAR